MVRHNSREHKSIIPSFLTYKVKQQDFSDKHRMIVVIKTLMKLLTYFKISVVSLMSGRNLVPQSYF